MSRAPSPPVMREGRTCRVPRNLAESGDESGLPRRIPVTLDAATKAKLNEAVAATGLTEGEVLRLAIESGLRVMETARDS
jgi:hypothetical protein